MRVQRARVAERHADSMMCSLNVSEVLGVGVRARDHIAVARGRCQRPRRGGGGFGPF
jgi:hypothetical protein